MSRNLPQISFFLVLPSLLIGLAFGDEPSRFVRTQVGELPIILSAPHGGKLAVPEVAVRKGEGLKTGGSGFVVDRDTGTEELSLQVAAAIEKRFGKKPYFVIARSHRKFLDPNRPPEIAYEDDNAKPVYDAYHNALRDSCRAVQEKFHKGLLLDIHGQGTAKDAVFRGTQDGKTVTLLRERFGEAAHTGESSLFSRLKTHGWKVHPDPFDGKEQAGFRGGFIVQTYGSHQGFGIDAIQLEFGADFRAKAAREKTATTLARAVADYSASFLDIPLTAEPAKNGALMGVRPGCTADAAGALHRD
jgi:N-formylglutamate amidohydrolase